ncbi:attachment protein [Yersinia enterocolitica]|nr:attachment protein [Yersinia enterocolitica]EKN4750022.1 attachment protein [Yersinia enterocolitica]EKN6107084.1 attachment protein [Yersinia enterocolitica]ELW7360060.1 attachment protein [Yersinia enterocolitica]HDL8401110.1 attachment protein [Yersinia enterocolitica]
MKYKIFIPALFMLSHFSFADKWESVYTGTASASDASDSFQEMVNGKTVTYWQISPTKLSQLCPSAKGNAKDIYDSVLPTYKSVWPDSQWRLTFQDDCSIKNNLGKQDDVYTTSAAINFSVDRSIPDNDDPSEEKTPEEVCAAKPIIDNTFNNVSDGYINYNGCEYEATGVIVCRNDKTVCAASWKPTGYVPDSGDVQLRPVSDDSSGGGSGGDSGSSGGGSSGGSSGSSISKDDIAAAVQTGVKSAASTVASEIRDSLTEENTSTKDQKAADEKTQANLTSLEKALNDGVRGAGKFADPDNSNARYGEGRSEMDLATSLAKSQLGIDKDSHGASWEAFLNNGALRPNIPTGKGCTDFIMFSGTVYQLEIGCDKLGDIKSMLSWVMYCLTFWYVFTSITSLLRKGDE